MLLLFEVVRECCFSPGLVDEISSTGTKKSGAFRLTDIISNHMVTGQWKYQLQRSSRGACEYRHLISSSSLFLSPPNASSNFQRNVKFRGPIYSLVSAEKLLSVVEITEEFFIFFSQTNSHTCGLINKNIPASACVIFA